MQFKTFSLLLLSAAALAAPERLLQMRDEYADVYASAYFEDMKAEATQTDDSSAHMRDGIANYAAALTVPTIDMPPSSIISVLMTAIPASYYADLTEPSARSSLISEINDGHYPAWYSSLPASVKSYISTAYGVEWSAATATASAATTDMESTTTTGNASTATSLSDSASAMTSTSTSTSASTSASSSSGSASSSISAGGAAPTGALAVGVAGAAGILGLAIVL